MNTRQARHHSLLLCLFLCASLSACSSEPAGEEGQPQTDASAQSAPEDSALGAGERSESRDSADNKDESERQGAAEDIGEGPDALSDVLDATLPPDDLDATQLPEDGELSDSLSESTDSALSDTPPSEPSDVEPTDSQSPDDSQGVTEEDAEPAGDIPCLFGGLPCPSGHYCATGGCGLGLEGICTEKPLECEPSDQSICACDGNTYASACFARQAGQHPIGPGPCPAISWECEVDTTGWGFGNGCNVDEYCFGGCIGEGFCKERPICGNAPGEVQCACNGLDYATPCKLASAGKNLAFEGWCGEPPELCGGPDALECTTPEAICDLQSCNPEAEGLCITDLECGPSDPPECGCDDVTYVNKCARIEAGVAFKHMGECGEGVCELSVPGDCGMGAYCYGDIGVCTGPGECKPAPFTCGVQGGDNVPVCGCDGITYPSMCEAQKADIPVLKYGECDT